MPRPATNDYGSFYSSYVQLVKAESVAGIVENYAFDLQEFYNALPDNKADYAYAEGKWTIKQVLQHIVDADRIFAYRALCISRGDSTPFPGFDQDLYVNNAGAETKALSAIKQEFNSVRAATDLLLLSFSPEQIERRGSMSNTEVTVNAIAFIIYGHLLHHKKILKERYL